MTSPPISLRRSERHGTLGLLVCAGCLFAFGVISFEAWSDKSATNDEPLHFVSAWIQTHYDDFRCNPEDPPLWKYYVAAGTDRNRLRIDTKSDEWKSMLEKFPMGSLLFSDIALYETSGVDADGLLRAARARMVLLGVALDGVIAWWAWRLRGPLAGVVAAGIFAFDPNFLAHAPLVKNDVPLTLIFVLLMAAVWLLGERATLFRCVAIVLLVGAALTTKFSGILCFPMLGAALAIRSMMKRPWLFLRWNLSTRSRRFGASAVLFAASLLFGYAAIWASYGFRFGVSPDPAVQFNFEQPMNYIAWNEMRLRQRPIPIAISDPRMDQWLKEWKPNAVEEMCLAANRYQLLPQTWIVGFLYTQGTTLVRRAFLCGEIRVQGWWYYFPLAMLFKTPLATLMGAALAIAVAAARLRRALPQDIWPLCALGIAPILYLGVAMWGNFNIGIRHVLPIYPFLFIFMGVAATYAYSKTRAITGIVLVVLFAGLVVETVAAYPDFIPFFNVASGGWRGGIRLLSDSNIDWGQDLPALARWQREHPGRQLYLCQFALPNPTYYGINYIEMDGAILGQDGEKRPSGNPPVYAISAVALQGTFLESGPQYDFYHGFLKIKPIDVLDGTIYLYDRAPPR
jgi:hypothetical protein